MSNWTAEHILSLAPDAGSAKSGRELANPRKWVSFAGSETTIWGECQGSGKLPYQTQVDLSEPAFKCSCPSRKFPCKHGLGLLLMYGENPAAFKQADPPVWVQEWLQGRSKRAQAKAEKATQPKEVDEAAQAKRVAAREKKIEAGLGELSLWMRDLVRTGLSGLPSKPYGFFEGMAARLVDAQAPGIARMVREMGEISFAGQDWAGEVLQRMGKIHLLVEGYQRLETLSSQTQNDIRGLVGWNEDQNTLLSQKGTQDRWLVLGQSTEQEERLRVRRSWLWGETSAQAALVLEFAVGTQALSTTLIGGGSFEGELVFFPSNYPLRALVKHQSDPQPIARLQLGYTSLNQALESYSDALGKNPWLERFPLPLQRAIPRQNGEGLVVRDAVGQVVPLHPGYAQGWNLLALSGGHPLQAFGEWDGQHLWPLSVWVEGWWNVGGEP